MATRRKPAKTSKTTAIKLESFTDLLGKLEVEAEKVVRRIVEKAETSSRDIKKGVRTLIQQVRSTGIASVAEEKSQELVKLANEVLAKAKEVQIASVGSLGNFNRDEIVREAKKNIDDIIKKINSSELMAKAKVQALNTKDQVLSILSIPSQEDVVKLSRKIVTLEGRVNKLTRKAA
ncbi:MAG: hypothetical protein IPJ69_03370 [Deltaproteobacteria bacterium]|nr:MAG: hypothetical protein IPJ69_03370 [Deltaproteobacteria bacterium]